MKAVERVFKSLDEEIAKLKKETGLHCLAGCGKCCTKPDIDSSPIEYLPLAFEWFQHGLAEEKLQQLSNEDASICINYSPLSITNQESGSCGIYTHRGLICRLFGFAASRDKNADLRFVTCKLIKEDQPVEFQNINQHIQRKEYVPVFSDYYKRLFQIDFKLANQIYPINKAIRIAIEEVLHYYAYRPFTSGKKAG